MGEESRGASLIHALLNRFTCKRLTAVGGGMEAGEVGTKPVRTATGFECFVGFIEHEMFWGEGLESITYAYDLTPTK